MNWNQVEGYWAQFRGRVREQWGVIMHSEPDVTEGRRTQVFGLLQRRYGAAESIHEVARRIADSRIAASRIAESSADV